MDSRRVELGEYNTHTRTFTRARKREQVLFDTRMAKKRCILFIKTKNPEN